MIINNKYINDEEFLKMRKNNEILPYYLNNISNIRLGYLLLEETAYDNAVLTISKLIKEVDYRMSGGRLYNEDNIKKCMSDLYKIKNGTSFATFDEFYEANKDSLLVIEFTKISDYKKGPDEPKANT